MTRADTFVFVYDISRALCLLRDDVKDLPGEFVDNYIKHTISSFQMVSVLGYRVDYLTPREIESFHSQIEATQELWKSIQLPVELAGEEVMVHRVGGKLWIVVPNR